MISAMRRRIRGILMSGKQFSLDSRMDLVQVSIFNTFDRKNTYIFSLFIIELYQ